MSERRGFWRDLGRQLAEDLVWAAGGAVALAVARLVWRKLRAHDSA